MTIGRPIKDLVGSTFGLLTVLSVLKERRGPRKQVVWKCKCSCANKTIVEVTGHSLTQGLTKSCGCLYIKHGAARTRDKVAQLDYTLWSGIKKRCYNKNSPKYKSYGKRGIKVWKVWKEDFALFASYIRTLENCPSDKILKSRGKSIKLTVSIDRINNDGNYEPGNIKWSTSTEQANNKQDTIYVTFKGETLPLKIMCKKYAVVSYTTVYLRLYRYKWDIEEALLTPSRNH